MSDRLKMCFPLDEEFGGIEAEWMWVKPISENVFEVDNSAFHVYGISYKDRVRGALTADSLKFDGIDSKSGHRTVRVRFAKGSTHKDFEKIWPKLAEIGCSFEGSQVDRPLYAIDIPPSASLDDVIGYLAMLEGDQLLEYEEADCF